MMMAQYETRLPADHDVGALREWLAERGSVWDGVPELYFKAILVREAGRFGAIANSWSSLYLWQHDGAFRDWLVRGGYDVVTDRYGRADIDTFVTLNAVRGSGSHARYVRREIVNIPPDTDMTPAFTHEIEQTQDSGAEPGVVAAVVGLNPTDWTFTRIRLSESEPDNETPGTTYEMAYFSRSLFESLPAADARTTELSSLF